MEANKKGEMDFRYKAIEERIELFEKLRVTFPDKIPILFYQYSNSQITNCGNEK